LVSVADNLPEMVQSLSDILTSGTGAFKPEDFLALGNIFNITQGIASAILMGGATSAAARLGKATGKLDIVNEALLELAQAFHRLNGTILDLSKVSNVLKGLDGSGITATVTSSHTGGDFGDSDSGISKTGFSIDDVQTKVEMQSQSKLDTAATVALDLIAQNTYTMIANQQAMIDRLDALNGNLYTSANELSVRPSTTGNSDPRFSRTYQGLAGGNVQDASNFGGKKTG